MSVDKLFIKTAAPLRASVCLIEKHSFGFEASDDKGADPVQGQSICLVLTPCWCSFLLGLCGSTQTLERRCLEVHCPAQINLSHSYSPVLLLMLLYTLKEIEN